MSGCSQAHSVSFLHGRPINARIHNQSTRKYVTEKNYQTRSDWMDSVCLFYDQKEQVSPILRSVPIRTRYLPTGCLADPTYARRRWFTSPRCSLFNARWPMGTGKSRSKTRMETKPHFLYSSDVLDFCTCHLNYRLLQGRPHKHWMSLLQRSCDILISCPSMKLLQYLALPRSTFWFNATQELAWSWSYFTKLSKPLTILATFLPLALLDCFRNNGIQPRTKLLTKFYQV